MRCQQFDKFQQSSSNKDVTPKAKSKVMECHCEQSMCTASRVFMLMSVAREQARIMSSCKDSLVKHPTQRAILTNVKF
jgi:hypothetical protein